MPTSDAGVVDEAIRTAEAAGLTLYERLMRTPGDAGWVILDENGRWQRSYFRDILPLGEAAAWNLRAYGVQLGDRVCLISPTSEQLMITLIGAWRLGATAVIIPHLHKSPQAFVDEVRRRVLAAAPALVVTTDDRAAQLAGQLPVPCVSLNQLRRTDRVTRTAMPMPSPESIGLLQFTSGTTSTPRAVPVTQAQLIGNVDAIFEHLGAPVGTVAGWLPLYHDMGIVSGVGAAITGSKLVVMSTEAFMAQPAIWFKAISEYRAEMTVGPNFGYRLAARLQSIAPTALDLSCLRVAVNGAEVVDARSFAELQQVLGNYGLNPTAMCPMYGLAEATLAVSGSRAGEAVRILEAPTAAARPGESGGHAMPSRPLVGCGLPVPGTEVRIRDIDGAWRGEGKVGEICVKSQSVLRGYWTATDGITETDIVQDGWLSTGDLGFLDSGELFVCGRIKDMVIGGGRNYYPEDYELVAELVPGVRSGNVVAFSIPERERMVVLVEGGMQGTAGALGRQVMTALRDQVEYKPHEVVVIAPGTLPKTSSGKRQRQLARDRYQKSELRVLHTTR